MAKRKKHSSRKKNISLPYSGGMKGILVNSALVLGGVYVGSIVANKIQKKDMSGEDLLGLDGSASKYATPAILIAGGLAGMTMLKNKFANKLAAGIVLAGGAKLVNAAAGKSVVSLGDADEEQDQENVALPGVGDVIIPGVGDDRVLYDDLPDNNEMMTTYHEPYVGEAGSVYVDENGNPIEGAEEEDLMGIFGDEDECDELL